MTNEQATKTETQTVVAGKVAIKVRKLDKLETTTMARENGGEY